MRILIVLIIILFTAPLYSAESIENGFYDFLRTMEPIEKPGIDKRDIAKYGPWEYFFGWQLRAYEEKFGRLGGGW